MSPNDAAVAIEQQFDAGANVWVHDLARDIPTRLSFGNDGEIGTVWSADSERLVYSAIVPGGMEVYMLSPRRDAERTLIFEEDQMVVTPRLVTG